MTHNETAEPSQVMEQKLTELEEARTWSPRLVARLEALLRDGDEDRLVHIDPLAFAHEHRLADAETIDLFLHAAKVGLVEMEWRVICPACGLALESFSSLRHVEHRLYCEICHVAVQANLDDFIQVAFTVSPKVRGISWHAAAQLPARTYLFRYRFCAQALLPDGSGKMRDLLAAIVPVCETLEPGAMHTAELTTIEGVFTGAAPINHLDFVVPVSAQPAAQPQRVQARLVNGRFVCDATELKTGKVILEVRNETDRRALVMVSCRPPLDADAAPLKFEPFLTGGRVLAQNTFRRLFRSEVLQASEGIGVRDVTMLFTDLKGSTALYEKIGDLAAFSLVRQHFDCLGEVVQAFDGAVVKTIGDAVMAVFHDPARALKAASRMLEAIDSFNREGGANDLVLKIGLHRGPSIAVTMNENVDYFGQTVNVAARVQSLAEGGEICFTDAIQSAPGCAAQLGSFAVRSRDEKLKGVEREVRVFAARRSRLGRDAA